MSKPLSADSIAHFQDLILTFYATQGRDFPWRSSLTPYHVVVSEIMLQQTQTYRVAPKFEQFITRFPDFKSLAQAPFSEVLAAWQGLGYNRRALALQKIASLVVTEFTNELPNDPTILETFPGIGKATASSICAFAFNMPTVFIETNIRAVFIHFFFPQHDNVHDKELMPLIQQTLKKDQPRIWYYALMDYGVMLKKRALNPSRKSAHHHKQSSFKGSNRELRGMIIKALLADTNIPFAKLYVLIDRPQQDIDKAVAQLCSENLIQLNNNSIMLPQ